MMRIFVVKPNNMQQVRDFLDANGISYSYENDMNIIFANLDDVPAGLEDIAWVNDPVFLKKEDGKWYFVCEGDTEGPHNTEHDARVHFKQYISWSGEFVNNAAHPRNDA